MLLETLFFTDPLITEETMQTQSTTSKPRKAPGKVNQIIGGTVAGILLLICGVGGLVIAIVLLVLKRRRKCRSATLNDESMDQRSGNLGQKLLANSIVY